MRVLCIERQKLDDKLKKNIFINHKIYCKKHGLDLVYTDHLYNISNLEKILTPDSCLIINNTHLFANIDLDYRSFINVDNLYLVAADNIHSIKNIDNDVFIIKKSEWSNLFLEKIYSNNIPISEYIQSCIESLDNIKLQNITLLHHHFKVLMHNIKSNNIIPKNTIITDITNNNSELMFGDCLQINKYLGIRS